MSDERFTIRSAVYLIPIKNGKVLLSRRFKTGWMDGKYSLIAGHLDGNESVFDSMTREAFEEVGIKVSKKDLKPVKVVHHKEPDTEYMDFFFTTDKWNGEPRIMEPDKCDDLNWFPIDNLPENILPHVRRVIETYKNNIPFFEYGWD